MSMEKIQDNIKPIFRWTNLFVLTTSISMHGDHFGKGPNEERYVTPRNIQLHLSTSAETILNGEQRMKRHNYQL